MYGVLFALSQAITQVSPTRDKIASPRAGADPAVVAPARSVRVPCVARGDNRDACS